MSDLGGYWPWRPGCGAGGAAIGRSEHDEVAHADNDPDTYGLIRARVLLLGGGRSPAHMTTIPFGMLHHAITRCDMDILPGLDHFAPDDKHPQTIAQHVQRFLEDAEL